MSAQGRLRGSVLIPPDQVYAIYRGVRDKWPGLMRKLPPEVVSDIKKLSREFEDLIFRKISPGEYRIWLGRGKAIHSKSGISYPNITIIYKSQQKQVPVVLESRAKEKESIRIDEIMASRAKATEIYGTYYTSYSKSLNVKPEDMYQVFVTNAPIDEEGIFYAFAYGILLICPHVPNAAVSLLEMEKFLKPKRLRKLKQGGFYSELRRLYDQLFRGHKETTKEVFHGAQLYKKLKLMCNAVTTMIGKH